MEEPHTDPGSSPRPTQRSNPLNSRLNGSSCSHCIYQWNVVLVEFLLSRQWTDLTTKMTCRRRIQRVQRSVLLPVPSRNSTAVLTSFTISTDEQSKYDRWFLARDATVNLRYMSYVWLSVRQSVCKSGTVDHCVKMCLIISGSFYIQGS